MREFIFLFEFICHPYLMDVQRGVSSISLAQVPVKCHLQAILLVLLRQVCRHELPSRSIIRHEHKVAIRFADRGFDFIDRLSELKLAVIRPISRTGTKHKDEKGYK